MSPVPLHNHTRASALDGLATPEEIADRCIELGFSSVACTDHDLVAGHVDFYKTMIKKEIKPILGIETYQTTGARQVNKGFRTDPKTKDRADNFHLILLAQNEQGLRNLYAMNTEAHGTGFYYNARVDWDLLEKYNEGLICTSACGLSLLGQALRSNPHAGNVTDLINRYQQIFGDRFYIELSTYTEEWQQLLNNQLIDIAQYFSIPMVYANDAHYAFPNQYELHETILCMQYAEKKSARTEPHHVPDLYIMGQKDIDKALFYLPTSVIDECVDNTDTIAEMCNVSLPQHHKHIPVFIPESRWSRSKDMLFDLAVEGYAELIEKTDKDNDVYMQRFKDEIAVIYKAELVDYLLMVRDVIMYAKTKGYLVGPGRGSIGGSLIAYLIGIHQIDPIKYGLIFERFYNVGRENSLPDIDVDFPTFAREDIKQFLIKKYGKDYVADVGTVSTMQGRAAIQKLGMTLEIPFTDTKAISALIEKAIESGQQPKWKDIWAKVGMELEPYRQKHKQLFDYAERLYGHPFAYGIHPSGIIISDVPLQENFPLRWHAKEKKLVTQWDMRIAEELGFMKFDALGLRNLDGLTEFNKIVDTPVDFDGLVDIEESLPEEMWELADNGLTVGIFQIEDSNTAKPLCKQIRPRNLEDIALITALNRPGPLKSGSHVRYIKGRNGEPVVYRHPIFEKIAKDTYGEIIYQEQFINFFIELGYTPVEADKIRAIVGKKKRKEMAEIKPDYLKRFEDYPVDNPVLILQAEDIWNELENFADYAFNKAHSIEYGLITLWTLYAKYVNPSAFYLGSMRSLVQLGHKDKIHRYIREAQRQGIEVLGPDLNRSSAETTIDNGAIRYGFADVKGIGLSPAKWLVKHGPFRDFDHVLEVAQDPDTKMTLRNGTRIVGVKKNQVEALKRLATLEGYELADAEEELLGVAIHDPSVMILEEYAAEIAKECVPISATDEPGQYTIAGVITEIKEGKTKNGDKMARVTIDNNGESKTVAVWSGELTRLSFIWRQRQAVIALIKVGPYGASIVSAKPLYSKKSEVTYANN